MRFLLHDLVPHFSVGGVGGVGGLTNMANPEDCSSLTGRTGTYCFQPGVLAGFTGFALAVLIAWTSPMLITALWVSNKPKRESEINVETFLKIWSLLTALWFIFPCAWFISDPFFRRDGFGILLAVTVAAAFPLSWHLSLVAVLSTTLSETLGMTRSSTLAVHKVVGYGAAGWAAVHAIGELVYFSRHGWDFFWKQLSLAKAEDGENLLYILGILAFVVFAFHMVLVQVRKRVSNFKNLHRAGAALLLLIAAAHWWPFALFLLPAAAGQGFCFASQVAERAGYPQTQQRKNQALFAALFGSLVGLSLVWILRQRVMQDGASLLTPFIFPPAAVLAEFISSTLVSLPILFRKPMEGSEALAEHA